MKRRRRETDTVERARVRTFYPPILRVSCIVYRISRNPKYAVVHSLREFQADYKWACNHLIQLLECVLGIGRFTPRVVGIKSGNTKSLYVDS